MAGNVTNHTLWVGNISYDASEEELMALFSLAGRVKKFRLMYDSVTQQPRGFGFLDYYERDAARAALRNLSGREIRGRGIKMAFTESSKGPSSSSGSTLEKDGALAWKAPVGQEAVTAAVSRLSEKEMKELITMFLSMIKTEPEKAKKMLNQNPPLAQAMMEIVSMMLLQKRQQTAVAPPVPPPEQKQELMSRLQMVLAMSDEQLETLPEEQRARVMAIKAQMAAQQ